MSDADETILLKEIPRGLMDEATRTLSRHSTGFVRADSKKRTVELLGSGTLVSIGKIRAILTAQHVVDALPRTGRLGLILEDSAALTTVDTAGLVFLPIARGDSHAEGPDVGAVILPASLGATVNAARPFYPLDKYRDRALTSPPDVREGFWVTNGFPDELTTEQRNVDGFELIKAFFNLSGVGGPDKHETIGHHDYFEFPVSYAADPDSPIPTPQHFGGMSGGGVWQVPLLRNKQDGQLRCGHALLSGLVFYQLPATVDTTVIRCHGRRTVYEVAYDAISAAV